MSDDTRRPLLDYRDPDLPNKESHEALVWLRVSIFAILVLVALALLFFLFSTLRAGNEPHSSVEW